METHSASGITDDENELAECTEVGGTFVVERCETNAVPLEAVGQTPSVD